MKRYEQLIHEDQTGVFKKEMVRDNDGLAHRALKEFNSYSIARDSSLDSKVAVCYYTAGTAFIKGCEYEYEVDECEPDREPGIINITEDEMAFELEGEYRWDAVRYGNASIDGCDSGTAYAIIKPNGNVLAKFYTK